LMNWRLQVFFDCSVAGVKTKAFAV
jgi:hypothetical protein